MHCVCIKSFYTLKSAVRTVGGLKKAEDTDDTEDKYEEMKQNKQSGHKQINRERLNQTHRRTNCFTLLFLET